MLSDDLLSAVKTGNFTRLDQLIIQHNIDSATLANVRDTDGYTLLTLAAKKGYDDIAILLLEKGVDVNDVKNITESSPLHFAAENGHLPMANKLLRYGAKINGANKLGFTPLFFAVAYSHTDLITFLIEKGANVNHIGYQGTTPLHVTKDANIAAVLLAANADPNIKNNSHRIPLHEAVFFNDTALVELLARYSDLNPDDIRRNRELSIVFNHELLNNLLHAIDPIDYEGGNSKDFVSIVAPLLEKFIADDKLDKLEPCLIRLKKIIDQSKLQEDQIIPELDAVGTVILQRGYVEHLIPAVISEISPDKYSMTLIDRGEFTVTTEYDPSRCFAVRTMEPINRQKLAEVLNLLQSADNLDKNEAADILFDRIPKVSGREYKNDERFIQKPFKQGQCFFENYKSLLLREFVHAYGNERGRLLYKQFDCMLHMETLQRYQDHFRDQIQENKAYSKIIDLCVKIIEKKKRVLMRHASLINDKALIDTLISQGVKFIHPSIEIAERLVFSRETISDEQLKMLKHKDPLHYKAYHAKYLADNNRIKEAQEMDVVFFDHYFIKGAIAGIYDLEGLQLSLSSSIFLKAINPDHLLFFANLYVRGEVVPHDLLTAESLILTAIDKIKNDHMVSNTLLVEIQKQLSLIREAQNKQLKMDKKSQELLQLYDVKQTPQQNLTTMFSNFNTVSFKLWNSDKAKIVAQLTQWLKNTCASPEEVRTHLLKERFSLLQDGTKHDASIITLLNVAVRLCSEQPKPISHLGHKGP